MTIQHKVGGCGVTVQDKSHQTKVTTGQIFFKFISLVQADHFNSFAIQALKQLPDNKEVCRANC